ncbi:Parcxpwfx02 [Gryllus bimaculatus]|nr:Parcxpwfx02 [Gryllus bimaculatus]
MVSRIFRDTESTELNRRRQIDTLKVFNDNVTEIQEDVEYKVEFTSGGNNMALLVVLGPDFPLTRPVLKIRPDIVHPWVNESSEVVTAPGLINYTAHSDLGRVVHAIIREFQLRPPQLCTDIGAGASSSQQNDVNSDGRSSPLYGVMYQTSLLSSNCNYGGMSQYSVHNNAAALHLCPRGTLAFPDLAKLTLEELKKLDENVDRQDEFLLQHHPDSQKVDMSLENMLMNNEEVAKENLSKEPRLQHLKTVVKKKLDVVASLKAQYESHSNEYQKQSEKYAPDNIRDNLRIATVCTDEESERVADEFLNKQLDVETFVTSYMEKRTSFYSRKTREEKLSRQLQELERAGY